MAEEQQKSLNLSETHGKTVINTFRSEDELKLYFSDGTIFLVNLTDPKSRKKVENEGRFQPKSVQSEYK